MNDQPGAGEFIQASRVLRVSSPLGEDQLLAERSGKIAKILCAAGDSVEVDQVILEFE